MVLLVSYQFVALLLWLVFSGLERVLSHDTDEEAHSECEHVDLLWIERQPCVVVPLWS